ncbi:LCP family protein, partial [Candidatus Peregrinibacteria bacterium]|nr:LCP family protein [Candidatus Peregrinibacteria bacterium]
DEIAEIPGQFNVLIAGKNGSLMDTMIFANINSETRKITLVSLPRDLYYNNRKINSYYALFGMEEMKRVFSNITGYKIDKFILIDMYAFIEVIDLIGGVDVHLDEAVIDPTYKVNDDGVWSTLYYRAGDHHLSGKQALRLARTRHTSSDFARAERQQMIIKALQTKARSFGFGDAATLNSMAQAVLSKTETDFNIADAISAYFRYQGFEVEGGNVLSSGNVLESKFTGDLKVAECKAKSTEAEDGQEKCQQDKGQYILLPRNGNWNTVKWYFHKLIEE